MAFTVNTNDLPENNQGLMPEGDYEVVIAKVEEKASQSGTLSIDVELVVRNDVNQSYKNKHVWYQIWDTQKTRESGMYAKNVNAVSKHAGIQNGASFNSIQEWGAFITGRPLLATIKHDTYNNKTREKVSFIGATKFPQCAHQVSQTTNNQQQYSQSVQQQPQQGYQQSPYKQQVLTPNGTPPPQNAFPQQSYVPGPMVEDDDLPF